MNLEHTQILDFAKEHQAKILETTVQERELKLNRRMRKPIVPFIPMSFVLLSLIIFMLLPG